MSDKQPRFVHLRVHSEYSIVDGMLRLANLMQAAADDAMPAIALNDYGNCFALIKFYKQALSHGIKPILGADIEWSLGEENHTTYHCSLLCMNDQGYRNLKILLSKAYLEGQEQWGRPVVQWSWLQQYADGLIVLSGALQSDLASALLAEDSKAVAASIARWQSAFAGRFYIECQRVGKPQEAAYIRAAVLCAQQRKLPLVATGGVCFLHAEDFEAHEARVCIQRGEVLDDTQRERTHTREQYFKTQAQMQQLFNDIPSALQNTVEISKRCNLQLTLGQHYLPAFPVPGEMTESSYLAQQAQSGLLQRIQSMSSLAPNCSVDDYQKRLASELQVITDMGFPGYFLIVADFITWSKQQSIAVGPGRGSGAGSLVAYALGITELDPLAYDLLFERFLNPERVSLPDFDIDFCMDRRDEVINYVAERYGRSSVSQIITYGSMAAKAVVRDVGRVQGLPYGLCDGIAKLIPFELGISLDKALTQEPRLAERYAQEDEVRELIDMARRLEGITRNAGKHAGGVVIASGDISQFAPLYCEPGSKQAVTQFDKDDAETIGLVKFDFLGLRTLTIIDWAVQAINKSPKQQDLVQINQVALDDAAVFKMLQACSTVAVFQLESRGMRDLIRRLQPDSFDDLIALVALFRPGPLQSGMVDDFIERKHGKAQVRYPDACLEGVLKPTYGIILYQEQVMQIAQVYAGYSLGQADLLRRAMGKKKPEEMAKQRSFFIDGATSLDRDSQQAADLFDLIEKFAGYGFNKSHSAAYALLSYQTAWLKCHYPAYFMAAVLSSDMDNTDKITGMVNEVRAMQLTLLPVDVNASDYYFQVNQQGDIVYGLGAVKGLGEGAVQSLLHERQQGGSFKDLFDFCERVDLHKLNKRALEALIFSGAFDSLKINRATLFYNLTAAVRSGEQKKQERAHGQKSMFAMFDAQNQEEKKTPYRMRSAWLLEDRLQKEYQALGLYFSGHPLTPYLAELKQVTKPIAEMMTSNKSKVAVAGLISQLRILKTKKDKLMAVLVLSDPSGYIDVTVFSEVLEVARPLLEKGNIVVVKGELGDDSFSGGKKILASKIVSLEQIRQHCAKRLWIEISNTQDSKLFLQRLPELLAPFQGGDCQVVVRYQHQGETVDLALGDAWQVRADMELLKSLMQLCGDTAARFEYT